jgi:hypothetical protein
MKYMKKNSTILLLTFLTVIIFSCNNNNSKKNNSQSPILTPGSPVKNQTESLNNIVGSIIDISANDFFKN